MAEYIEREKIVFGVLGLTIIDPAVAAYANAVLHQIQSVPSADVAQVRHGRWIFGKDLPYNWGKIPKNKYHLYCSECLEQAFNRSEDNDPDFDVDTSYCPNCGCRMDGGDDE